MAKLEEGAGALLGGLPIPKRYPTEWHARLEYAAHEYFERAGVEPHLQSEFRAAWRAVVHRFVAADESAVGLAESLGCHGDAPPQPERYLQERDFFHFVVNSVACLEALHYGIYAWGACRQLRGFALSTEKARRKVCDSRTLAAVSEVEGTKALADALNHMQTSDPYVELRNARVVLFHRCLPGRHVSASTCGRPSQPSRYADFGELAGPDISPNVVCSRLHWLSDCLERVISLAADWVEHTSAVAS